MKKTMEHSGTAAVEAENARLRELLKEQRISENRLIAQMHRMQRNQDEPFVLSEQYQEMKEWEQMQQARIRELETELACTRQALQELRERHERLEHSYERLGKRLSGRKDDLARREELLDRIRREPGEPSRDRAWERLGISRATYYRYRRQLQLQREVGYGKND